ncbi:MAG: universal stress protein [bacterium]
MVRKIIVTTDFSECGNQAVPYAIELARQMKADLFVVTIIEHEKHESSYFIDWKPLADPENEKKAKNEATARLRKLIPGELPEGVKVTAKARVDENAVKGVQDLIDEIGADLLIISSHGLRGFERFLLGSTAERILRSVDCPVLMIKVRGDKE